MKIYIYDQWDDKYIIYYDQSTYILFCNNKITIDRFGHKSLCFDTLSELFIALPLIKQKFDLLQDKLKRSTDKQKYRLFNSSAINELVFNYKYVHYIDM